jgi:hypothetical protein
MPIHKRARLYIPVLSGFLLLACFGAAPVSGATLYTFETDGLGPVPLFPATIQSGWYTATVAGSVAASVGSYSALNFAGDPGGGAQALVLANTPSTSATRAQHAFDFTQGTQWTGPRISAAFR